MTSNAPKHLEFSNEADSQGFLNLYENGYISGNISFAFGDEIETLINDHIDEPDWQICYQKSLMLYDRRDFADAKKYCEKVLFLIITYIKIICMHISFIS